MDCKLIGPSPDFRWHVRKLVFRRIADLRNLCALVGCNRTLRVQAVG
jgi:hypothetical protein